MITDIFKCNLCNHLLTFADKDNVKDFECPRCDEGTMKLRRTILGDGRKTTKTGDYRLVSQSLAISPSQIEEHKRLFPDVEVHKDGCLEFNSYRSHDKYLEKTGFQKRTQRIRNRL